MSASRSTLRPVTLPSLVAVRVRFCHWSRPWWPDNSDSERVSVHLQGLPVRWASRTVMISSGVICSLPPKPPPTSGAMTRILLSEMPRTTARKNRMMCGTCVELHTVSCSPVGSTTTERGSMKAGMRRCWRYSRSMTMPLARASAMASSMPVPVPALPESNCQKAALFVPRSGWASTVSAAASLRSSAAGSCS